MLADLPDGDRAAMVRARAELELASIDDVEAISGAGRNLEGPALGHGDLVAASAVQGDAPGESGWVRWCARLLHDGLLSRLSGLRGVPPPAGPFLYVPKLYPNPDNLYILRGYFLVESPRRLSGRCGDE
jgi:hypothetical protein